MRAASDCASESPRERGTHDAEAAQREPGGKPCSHRHDLAHHEKRQPRRHADPHRVGNLDRAALTHGLLGGDRHHPQHESRHQNGEDRDERVVRQLCEPRLEEALGRLEEEKADKQGTQREKHRECDSGKRKKKDRIDRGQSHNQINSQSCQVVREIAIQQSTLRKKQVRRITAIEQDLIDDRDRIKRPDDDGREFGRPVEESVDDEGVVKPKMQRAPQDHGQRDDLLQSPHECLFDLPGQLQIAPHHDVDDRERDDHRLHRGRDPRRGVTDVAGEERVQPTIEFREEAHVLALSKAHGA